jgi:predicted DNA-binding ribbon-helix-helix protein
VRLAIAVPAPLAALVGLWPHSLLHLSLPQNRLGYRRDALGTTKAATASQARTTSRRSIVNAMLTTYYHIPYATFGGSARSKAFGMKTVVRCSHWGAGHRGCIRLDGVAREALGDIAGRKGCTIDDLLAEIDRGRGGVNFAAATRRYVVAYYRAMMQAALHGDAGRIAR